MAFQTWSADQSDDNENALEIAEQMRSEAQITYQNAKTAYEDYKTLPGSTTSIDEGTIYL